MKLNGWLVINFLLGMLYPMWSNFLVANAPVICNHTSPPPTEGAGVAGMLIFPYAKPRDFVLVETLLKVPAILNTKV